MPVHFAKVHEVAGQPHSGVVVHITGLVELAHSKVNGGNAGAGLQHVSWHIWLVGVFGQQPGVDGLVNVIAHVCPHMPVVGAPAQFKDKFVLGVQRVARVDSVKHFAQAQQTVRQIGREACDCTIQRVACARVGGGLHGGQAGMGCLQGGFKVVHGGAQWLAL